ncbi:MAG: hypothetical protein AAGF12_03760 [Myxococcota bacterium]
MSQFVFRSHAAESVDGLLTALDAAREQGSLEPLADFMDIGELDPQRHILTGRKFLLFGPAQRDLIATDILLDLGLHRTAHAAASVGNAPEAIATRLQAAGRDEGVGNWLALLQPGHGVPPWLQHEGAPGILRGDDLDAFRASLAALLDSPAAAEDPGLAAELTELQRLADDPNTVVVSVHRSG